MDQSTNSQSNATGGSVPTGNPQDIGVQSLGAPTSEGQSQTSNLLNNNSSLRLTDQNGQPINVNTTTQIPAQSTTKSSSSIAGIMIISGLIAFVIVFAGAWLFFRQKPTPEKPEPEVAAKSPVKKTSVKKSKKAKKSKKTKKTKKK